MTSSTGTLRPDMTAKPPIFELVEAKKRQRGFVYGWGTSKEWELGLGEVHENIYEPVLLKDIQRSKIVLISAGSHHSACVNASGELYTFGKGKEGQLGHNDTETGHFPRKIAALKKKKKVLSVSLGDKHSACILAERGGTCYIWGCGTAGQLGLGGKECFSIPQKMPFVGKKVVSVSCGDLHSAAIILNEENEKEVYTWGDGKFGKLGNSSEESSLEPYLVDALEGFQAIRVMCGPNYTAVLTSAGDLVTFGSGESGRLGHGSETDTLRPLTIPSLSSYEIVDASVGMDHMAAVTSDGTLLTWGYGSNGRLGLGDESDRHSPVEVKALEDKKIVHVACGGHHTVCVDESGKVYGMGWNHHGQLGIGDFTDHALEPVQVQSIPTPVIQVVAGEFHTLALVADLTHNPK